MSNKYIKKCINECILNLLYATKLLTSLSIFIFYIYLYKIWSVILLSHKNLSFESYEIVYKLNIVRYRVEYI